MIENPSVRALGSSGLDRATGILAAALLGIGAVAVVLAVLPSALFDLDRFTVPKELALLVTGLLAGVMVLLRADRIELGMAELGLAGFSLLSVASAVAATNRWISFRALGVTVGGLAVFFVARIIAGRLGRGAVVVPLLVAVVVAGSTGLFQAYGWSSNVLADTRAPGGTLGNRNFMAHLMVLGLPLAGWLVASARGRLAGGFGGVAIAVMIAATVLSRSRAAWVGAGTVVVVASLAALVTRGGPPRISRQRLTGLVLAGGLGALAALVVPNHLEWRSSSPYRDSFRDVLNYREGSGRGRLIQYQNSLELVRQDPFFGTGPGNWLVKYPLVTTPNDPSFDRDDPIPTNPWPSSDWIALMVERGPLGAGLWLVTGLAFGLVAIRRARDPDHGAAAIAGLALLAGAAVEGLFDAVFLLAPPTMVVMAGIGALLPATRPVRHLAIAGRRLRSLGWFVLVTGGLAAKSGGQAATILSAGNGWSPRDMEAAIRFDPGNYRLHLLLAARTGCPAALSHALAAKRALPFHPVPARLLRRCR